jgi:serine/threonine protein kinase
MEYKIKKIIGKGFFSVVYLIHDTRKNDKFILKRQKILKKNINNKKDQIWNEISFSKFINKLSKNKRIFFMKMYDYKINDNCNKTIFTGELLNQKEFQDLNNSNYCVDIIYEKKNKTFYNLLKKNTLSLKNKYSFLAQIFYALSIMKKSGYNHNDLHPGNIMYNISKKGEVKIKNKKIKSKYIYSLIDYGLVSKNKKINQDLNFLQILNRINILVGIYRENNWKLKNLFEDPNLMYYHLIEMYKYKDLWEKIKIKVINKNSKYKKFYELFDKDINIKKINEYLWNNVSIANIDIYISNLFLAYDSKKYYQIFGLNKIENKQFIPGEDIEFIVLNFYNYNKISNYFLKKL